MNNKYEINGFLDLQKGHFSNEDLRKDELKRGSFAKKIAMLIKNDAARPHDTSTVIGIEGDWGSGKSFTISKIREHLNEKDYLWLTFEPWKYKSEHELIEKFLEWFSYKIARADKQDKNFLFKLSRRWGVILPIAQFINSQLIALGLSGILLTLIVRAFGSLISGLFFISPIAGTLLTTYTIGLLYLVLRSCLKSLHIQLESSPYLLMEYAKLFNSPLNSEDLKNQIRVRLKKEITHKRIIIIIEDIDRLSPCEVEEMLSCIKLISDFPQITYLIPYDKTYVENALNSRVVEGEKMQYGSNTLQKVIFSSYRLPGFNPMDNAKPLFEYMERMAHQYPETIRADMNRGEDSYWNGFKYSYSQLLETPRHREKVTNKLLLLFVLSDIETHPADALVVSYLMEYQAELWKLMLEVESGYKGGSLTSYFSGIATNDQQASREPFLEEMKSRTYGGDKTFRLIYDLFRHHVFTKYSTNPEELRLGSSGGLLRFEKLAHAPQDYIVDLAKKFLTSPHYHKLSIQQLNLYSTFEKATFDGVLERICQNSKKRPTEILSRALFLSSQDEGSFELKNTAYKLFGWSISSKEIEDNRHIKRIEEFVDKAITGGDLGLALLIVYRMGAPNQHIRKTVTGHAHEWEKIAKDDWQKLKLAVLKKLNQAYTHSSSLLDFLNTKEAIPTLDLWFAIDPSDMNAFIKKKLEEKENYHVCFFLDQLMHRIPYSTPAIQNELELNNDETFNALKSQLNDEHTKHKFKKTEALIREIELRRQKIDILKRSREPRIRF